ncbi:MAG: LPS export ABC transporter ATP-binding protein [Candidatus Aminicenantaceae bacterium]
MKSCLEAKNLEKSFNKKKVVNNVSIKVRRGEIVGLLGPNGAGKTTSFSLILGLITQDRGKIFLDGEDISRLPMYIRAQKGLSLLPQEPSAFRKLSVEENLLSIMETVLGIHSKRDRNLVNTLKEFGLEKLVKAKAYTLSGGERRRLEIARALITNPRFILLDEPFTGIDPLAILDLQEIILSLKEKGIGVVVTDHRVRETLKIADRGYIINDGRILKEGTPQELVNSEKVKSNYLGQDFQLS